MKEIYTVRRLINEAYRASTVRGIGDVASSEEAEDALVALNDHLDQLTADPEFNTGKKAVDVIVGSKGYVSIGNNPSRIVTNAVISSNEGGSKYIEVHTSGQHGIADMSNGTFFHDNVSVRMSEISVLDPWSFKANVHSTSEQGKFVGRFLVDGDPEDLLMDIVDVPPVSIFQVYDGEGNEISELEEQVFYGKNRRGGKWWFYDKHYAPYPKVWIGGCQNATIIYTEPFWNGIDLDTDITLMPASARQALKWNLASLIAEENGYIDVADRLEKRFKKCYAEFCESSWQNYTINADSSAPGYVGGGYDIRTDGGF